MKYSININQKAIIENWFNLDLIDCAIIDYIKDFSWTWKMIKTIIDGQEYFWIQYEHFIKEMPLLWIKNKQALKKRIDKIIYEWILEKVLLNWNSTYFRFWSKYCLLISDKGVVSKVEGGKYDDTMGGSMESWSINNNIINNKINNNIIEKKSKDFSIIKKENLKDKITNEITPDLFIEDFSDKKEFEKELLNFYNYWTERKMKKNWDFIEKWEKEEFFEINKRFRTWVNNSKKFWKKQNNFTWFISIP
jgi:hypothetical protein